jgi:hypothetical protein
MDLYRKEARPVGPGVPGNHRERARKNIYHLNHKFIFIVKLRGGGTCGNEGAHFIFIAGST